MEAVTCTAHKVIEIETYGEEEKRGTKLYVVKFSNERLYTKAIQWQQEKCVHHKSGVFST